jgi:hypothetical protein
MGILKRQLRIRLLAGDHCFDVFLFTGDRRTHERLEALPGISTKI